MFRILPIVFAALLPIQAAAQESVVDRIEAWKEAPSAAVDAKDVILSDFTWIARPIVVFADSPNDPRFIEQMSKLASLPNELVERDVVIIVDTDPSADTALREELRPRGFMMVLLSKDGGVTLRKPFPWDVRELSRSIDKMPIRKREIIERRAAASN